MFVFQKEGVRSGGFQFPHLSIDFSFLLLVCDLLCRLSVLSRLLCVWKDLQQALLKLAVLDYIDIIALNNGAVY